MNHNFTYGYLQEAVRAHLDLAEDELETIGLNQRFHIFANEAMQQLCNTKPKATYFIFQVVEDFKTLVYDNGELRLATIEEVNWQAHNLTEPTDLTTIDWAEPTFADDATTINWYNTQGIYKVGQIISMPSDHIVLADKQAYFWSTSINNRINLPKAYYTYMSNTELVAYNVGYYQIPYYANWLTFTQADHKDNIVQMPANLLLTIPIYVASILLQQRNTQMAQAKRQEFEIAVSRCKVNNFLDIKNVSNTFVR